MNTYAEIIALFAPLLRMRPTHPTHQVDLYAFLNAAIVEMGRRHNYPFLDAEFTKTLTAARVQSVPSTLVDDVDGYGTSYLLKSFRPNSVRIGTKRLILKSEEWILSSYPEWRSGTPSGEPQYFCTIGRDRMGFCPVPSAAYVASASALTLRGWRRMRAFQEEADHDNRLNAETEIPECGEEGATVLGEGILVYGFRRQGVTGWDQQEERFQAKCDELAGQIRPVAGGETDQLEVPEVFDLDDNLSPVDTIY